METKRRDRIQIVGDLLRLQEATKTQIVYGIGFNGRQANMYIDFLVKRGFIETVQNHQCTKYRTTPSGKQLLKQIDKLTQLLE